MITFSDFIGGAFDDSMHIQIFIECG